MDAIEIEAQGSCPVCGGVERTRVHDGLRDTLFGAPGTWSLHHCSSCSALFLDPRPTQTSIARAYCQYYTHASCNAVASIDAVPPGTLTAKIKFRLRNGYIANRYGLSTGPAWRFAGRFVPYLFPWHRLAFDTSVRHLSLVRAGARLLDVGCGSGEFLATARSLGWDALGLEVDPVSCAIARARGIPVKEAALEDAELDDESFDAVTMNHVIEHLHDPVAALARLMRLLTPGGCVWIATPNAESPLRRLQGAYWRGLEIPRHLVLFSRKSLELALQRVGFAHLEWPRTYPITEWMLEASPDGGPAMSRHKVRMLNVASAVSSRWSEQLVVMARKP